MLKNEGKVEKLVVRQVKTVLYTYSMHFMFVMQIEKRPQNNCEKKIYVIL